MKTLQSRPTTATTRLRLALCALACLLALQVWETTHHHDIDTGPVDCLVCSGPAGIITSDTYVTAPDLSPAGYLPGVYAPAQPSAHYRAFYPRGPPALP